MSIHKFVFRLLIYFLPFVGIDFNIENNMYEMQSKGNKKHQNYTYKVQN